MEDKFERQGMTILFEILDIKGGKPSLDQEVLPMTIDPPPNSPLPLLVVDLLFRTSEICVPYCKKHWNQQHILDSHLSHNRAIQTRYLSIIHQYYQTIATGWKSESRAFHVH